MMKKNRIATRVKDKTGIAKSKNRSEELADLRSRYGTFSKNLKFLISTLNGNLDAMKAHSRSRLEVAKAVNAMTVDTPLFGCAGDIPSHAVGTVDGGPTTGGEADSGSGGGTATHDAAPPTSYAAVHLALHKKGKLYAAKYAEHIVSYATEWERILTARIGRHLKEYDKLRVDLDHYGRKVEDINKTHNKTMSKGKSVQEKGVDKLRRNEQKLVQARQEYDRFVNDLCTFLEEVLERGWKDLLPLLVKMGQFDATLCGEEHSLLRGSMAGVTAQMTEVASRYPSLSGQGRLKELESASLESLARSHPSEREHVGVGTTLAIAQAPDNAGEMGVGGGGLFGTLTEPNQGLGGSSHHGSLGGGALSPLGAGGALSPLGGAENPPRSRADTGDSGAYDWAAGGPVHPPPSAPQSGNSAALSQRMSSGSLAAPPAFPPAAMQGAMMQDLSASGLATGAMLATMSAAAPPPTLDDVFASSQRQPSMSSSQHSTSRNNSSYGADAFGVGPQQPPMMPPGPPPPPPSAAPPAPPQAGMAQMSLYPSAVGSGASSNPFDGSFVGGGGGGQMAPPPSSGGLPPTHPQLQQPYGHQGGGTHSAPSTGGLSLQQQRQVMYGGQAQQSFGSGSSSTNPFG